MMPRHVVVLNWKDHTHPEAGGAEVYCGNVARELATAGVRVTYVTSRPAGAAREELSPDGYRIRRLGGRYTMYPLVLLWLVLHRRRVDAVIDSQNGIPFFSPLAVRRSCAVTLLVHHVHQDQFDLYFPPALARLGRWLEGPASRRVYGRSAVCAVSPSTRTEVRRRLQLPGPVFVVPNGYRRSDAARVARSVTPRIACVGRLVPHKRWELLVEAVATLVERGVAVHLDLVGDGPERDRLQRLVRQRGLTGTVTLHGYVTDAARDELLGRAWLSACTSLAEGWGLSVIESAAQGVPTVALDVAGLRDSVRPGSTGWLTSREDLVDTLQVALAELSDPAVAERTATQCRAWADALRWEWTADRLLAVLSGELLRAVRPPHARGAHSDSSVLITLPRTLAAEIDPHELHITDQTTFCPACVDRAEGPLRVLLHGADELDAAALLERLGIGGVDGEVSIRLCRPRDLVQWHVGGVAHNAPTLLTRSSCPAAARRRPRSPERQPA